MESKPETPNPVQQIMQVATGYIASSALYVAVALKIADHLASGVKTAEELARTTGTQADALYRVLRLLASVGIFQEVSPRRFGLTPAAEMLRTDVAGSIRGMALFLPDPLHFRVYANLMDSVRTGRPAAETTFGMPVFEYLANNPDYSEVFNDAMTALSAPVAGAAIDAYDFSQYRLIVDVAGGHGEVLTSILEASPGSRGVLAEVGHVLEGARRRIERAGLSDRCQAVECDFFKAVPPGGDAYLMKHIIHDWDDTRASTILQNIVTAMGNTRGAVILFESVIPNGPEPDLGKFVDIEMLLWPGGRERTAEEFRTLFDRSGFELTKIVPTKSPLSVIEGIRK